MTSLHYTLIALGIGLVAAVMLYNAYQERRSRKQAERLFQLRDGEPEVSLSEIALHDAPPERRIEPSIAAHEDGHQGAPVPVEAVIETAPMAAAPASVAVPVPDLAPESPLDPEIEYIARLRYTQPTALSFAPLLEALRRISKPIRMVGCHESGAWEPVAGHGTRRYDTIELGLLLADRSGPVSEVQIDSFCRRLYEFAAEHGGAVSCQDKAEALAKAQALDAFCAEVDMLIGLNLLPDQGGEFEAAALHDLATRAGLVQEVDGGYTARDALGRVAFTLADGGEAQGGAGLTLLFDVPRVGDGLAAFDRMTDLGFTLADRLGGRLVDDAGRPVTRASLERDRQSLETLYARLAARGVPGGGERALRLFA
ncbi:MAG: cell division protein ZipA C-terminal FtsZ-binding domain-containing protein [Pseudomonadota bacterium]